MSQVTKESLLADDVNSFKTMFGVCGERPCHHFDADKSRQNIPPPSHVPLNLILCNNRWKYFLILKYSIFYAKIKLKLCYMYLYCVVYFLTRKSEDDELKYVYL